MADAVTSRVVSNSNDEYLVHLTNISDGTAASSASKVDMSALTTTDSPVPSEMFVR